MSDNEFEVVIRLPKSDRFHSKDDRHLAEIVKGRVERLLQTDPTQWRSTTEVEVRQVEPEGP